MTDTETTAPDAISVEHIAKSFGNVRALDDVSLRVRRGEVLGLIGDNGAGKSTLMKILTGYHRPDSGRIVVDGQEVQMRSVSHARDLGIEAVYQDLALIDTLPVYINMHLNKELRYTPLPFLKRREMRKRARRQLDDMGVRLPDVTSEIRQLSGGQRQAIAVARSVYADATILLLDEPLAAMGAKEAGLIIKLVMDLRERGDLAILLIAHNYHQIVEVCDRVNLLQHGEITFDRKSSETSVEELMEIVSREYRLNHAG
ncbi:MAG: ATP-binding cassette domain-containing protein [Streptosporangiaceae bacterium]